MNEKLQTVKNSKTEKLQVLSPKTEKPLKKFAKTENPNAPLIELIS